MATSHTAPPAATAFTRFIFLVGREAGETFLGRLRSAGGAVARGFFNDFDADGARDAQAREAIQFLVAEGETYPDSVMAAAGHVVQVTGKYRPKLEQVG